MKFLIVSTILFIVNANPLTSTVNNGQHFSKSLSRVQRSVSLGSLERGFKVNGHPFRLPAEIQLQVFEHLPMTFEEAKEIASEKGVSIDWAYQYHDPSKDKYAIVKEWLKMDSPQKDELKEKMMLNPTLRKLLKWKEGLSPTGDNLKSAIRQGNLDIVKCLIAIGVNPDQYDLYASIILGNSDIVEVLIKKGKIYPNRNDLFTSIRQGNPEIFKCLIQDGRIEPERSDFNHAILSGKLDIVKYMIQGGYLKPNIEHLNHAIRGRNLDIVNYLIQEGKVVPSVNNLDFAIQWRNVDIVKYLIQKGVKPNQVSFYFAIKSGLPEIIEYLTQGG